jgi:predicted nucleotide-binding protein
MEIAKVIEKVQKLIQDVTDISSTGYSQSPEQFNEHLRSWQARASEELRNCGLPDASERFANTSHSTRANSYKGNLINMAEAKRANLTALLEDMKKNSAFYQEKLARRAIALPVAPKREASSVFLGHGRSSLWAKVNLFLEKDLKLRVQVWEAESREGRHTIEVLQEMIECSRFAVLIMTGEDLTGEGERRARQNVVHEIGLFQGHLGFSKVALLEQEGIEGCSNLLGLQTIRFHGEDIENTFYRLQKMLQREGLI